MEEIREQRLTGERALFSSKDLDIRYCIFADGESPLKECENIRVTDSSFQWKYPLWYCKNIEVANCTFSDMARAGIWYVENISVKDCLYEAPKGFRKIQGLNMENIDLPQAEETLWKCRQVQMKNVDARGDYFGMDCHDIRIEDFRLTGNYCFDGCSNVEVRNAKMLSKDAFWNCENVTVYDSYITGEYLGWNSKKLTFVNCVIESLQGMCYIEDLVMKNCRLLNTTLAFEYSTRIDAEIITRIDSVKNPASGVIRSRGIDELILEEERVDVSKTKILEIGRDSDGV
ncbi:MAG: DUF3737 family protein [Lachnospiraceae bacterium]|nr:DUF3737 family protein [Lachnospiraceae bacterium]